MADRIRKSITSLTDAELAAYRSALSELYRRESENGYQALAGLHGLPNPSFCPHNDDIFLSWHRAYIFRFEDALREIDPEVTLPYWKWDDEPALTDGLPDLLAQQGTFDMFGRLRSNPLYQACIGFDGRPTLRNPRAVEELAQIAEQVSFAMVEVEYLAFNRAIEGPHGWLHVWVGGGGDMSSVRTAAFDPIFWLHHANVDRQWARWQKANPDAEIPADHLERELAPFDMTVAQTIDHEAMGFVYDDHDLPVTIPRSLTAPVRLHLTGLRMTEETVEIRIFLNLPGADASTATVDNPNFAAAVVLLGMEGAKVGHARPAGSHGGMGHGGMGHGGMDHGGMDHGGMDHGGMDHGGMDHEGSALGAHGEPFERIVEIGPVVERLNLLLGDIEPHLVFVDKNGRPVPAEEVPLDRVFVEM